MALVSGQSACCYCFVAQKLVWAQGLYSSIDILTGVSLTEAEGKETDIKQRGRSASSQHESNFWLARYTCLFL